MALPGTIDDRRYQNYVELGSAVATRVGIFNSSGTQIDSFGSGTQYAVDAALGAAPTGTLALAKRDDSLSALTPIEGDAVELRVDANGALWTLDSNSVAMAASLSVLDDWDETNRCAVNLISGQVGVAGGTGVDAATVLRVSLATNVALPAGTNAIGKLAANSGVDIGDVDVTSVIPGTGATNAGKAVGSTAGATDTGVAMLAVRDDALGALTPIEGNYVNLRVDANGALWTHDDSLDAALAGSELQVDIVGSLPAGTAAIGKLAANSGVDIGDVDILSIAAGDNNIGNVDIVTVPTDPFGANADAASATGSISAKLRFIANTGIPITGTVTVGSHAVTNAGTFAVQDSAAETSLAIMDDWDNGASDGCSVSGDVAHDTADAGEPVKIGGKAVNAEPTAVAANDRVNALFDLVGKMIVLPYANPENFVSGAITSAMTGTTSTSLVAAPAAGLRNYITTIICSNAHATVGTDIIIQDGSGGTTLLTIPAAAVYGGAVITLPTPLRQPTTATAIFCANVTTGASTKVSAVGYKGA